MTWANFTNSGPDAIPANSLEITLALISQPGTSDPDAATPYEGKDVWPNPLDGWELVEELVFSGPLPDANYTAKWYESTYRYTRPLAAGETTSWIGMEAVPTLPQPDRADYGTNFDIDSNFTNYGHQFYSNLWLLSCNESTGEDVWQAGEASASQDWGVAFGMNPDGSRYDGPAMAAAELSADESPEDVPEGSREGDASGSSRKAHPSPEHSVHPSLR